MYAFLYKNNESKLFNNDEEYESALADGWTDTPAKAHEDMKAREEAKKVILKVERKYTVEDNQQKGVDNSKKFKKQKFVS